MTSVGDLAPDFTLTDQFGNAVTLSDYRGRWTLVWWIPSTMAEMTPSCADRLARKFGEVVSEAGLAVVGMSFDDQKMLLKFAQRASVLFPLVTDEGRVLADEYGVRRHDEWDCFPRKVSFLVSPDGYVAEVFRNIDADYHVAEVQAAIDRLSPAPQLSWLRRRMKV